jgi:putative tryptophan/tyrosine transport system substrate-binding protein
MVDMTRRQPKLRSSPRRRGPRATERRPWIPACAGMNGMERRTFISLLGGAAVAWPLAARAQQSALPVIGFLNGGSAAQWAHLVAAFRKGLSEVGYIEGQNVAIEFRWAEGQYDRLPAMAADLVQRRVAVIASGGGDPPALAAKAATTSIPIVFTSGNDPTKSELVSSLGRPSGNITGVSSFVAPVGSKRLDLLHQLVGAAFIGVLVNPINPSSRSELAEVEAAAQQLARQLLVVNASSEAEIEAAFSQLAERKVEALLVANDSFFTSRRLPIVTLAARHALPAIYIQREYVELGGLISYGIDFKDIYRQLGIYAGRILKGAKPTDLPVLLPTKFELLINLKTAKAPGLAVPDKLLVAADEVIE